MSYDSLVNEGDYFSAHYLAEVLPKTLKGKDGPFRAWAERERAERERAAREGDTARPVTPRAGLRALRSRYFADRPALAEELEERREGARPRDAEATTRRLRGLHRHVLSALGYAPKEEPAELLVDDGGEPRTVRVALREPTLAAVECGWAPNVDAALDPDRAGRLLDPVELGGRERIGTGAKLATWLLTRDPELRYVLVLAGGVVLLADRSAWGEGRYLAVSLDTALGRNDEAELGTIAALFGAERLLPPEEGGAEPLAELLTESRDHAVGVSAELRDGLRDSVEIIANEVLDRLHEQGVAPERLAGSAQEFADELAREALRYLYRVLFLLYAEARPELGVVPARDELYQRGYSMARLGDLVWRDLVGEEARRSTHLYESLEVLFRMVNEGHRSRGGALSAEAAAALSEGEGLRFEALKADLFDPGRTRLIGHDRLTHPDHDPDDPAAPCLDTRLRNDALYRVLRLLMLARGDRKGRGGFISYARLGINQLGAVYEGLMSYTGFIASEELYEAARNGDPSDGSWLVPASRVDDYPDGVWVRARDEDGHRTDEPLRYRPGAFVYRLSGRDRQTSASYYTPESLTRATVRLALRERLDPGGEPTPARELLEWTICEPALGSGAFLNEAIDQVAAEYLRRREREVRESGEEDRYGPLTPENHPERLQAVKAHIALHNCYGVDRNATAVELAEVSLWLNVMHPGLQAPWFGLHLRRGDSLIGATRGGYAPDALAKAAWLRRAPTEYPLSREGLPEGHIHQFLLPAHGWGAAAAEKEAKALDPEGARRLAAWRKAMRRAPKAGGKRSQVARLQGLARRVEYLWELVVRRLEISEREIGRRVDVWGADRPDRPEDPVPREKVLKDLTIEGTPYWRLKTMMDAWCALWFWPVQEAGMLDGGDEEYRRLAGLSSASGASGDTAPVPLAGLDDWITFAEALVGTADVTEGTLAAEFATLGELSDYEDGLPGWTGMTRVERLPERFPWLRQVERIAARHGFFHWELQFAHIFRRGGFDLQVGNPPWVRPRWEEDAVLAEYDPWFALTDKPPVETKRQRKGELLERPDARAFFLTELADTAGMSGFLSDDTTYPLLAGTQPDLYRGFMCRTWTNLGERGTAGLLHPDTHFGGAKEGRLRAAAYRHLRLHAHFFNRTAIFPDIHSNTEFGIHIYGTGSSLSFRHISWLFSAETLMASLTAESAGELPGIKHEGKWDLRPHHERLLTVGEEQLAAWRELTGAADVPVERTPLLYPVTTAEAGAIQALADYGHRLGVDRPHISRGYDEANAKKDGTIRWHTDRPASLDSVILQGPHFSQATPFAKQPKIPCKSTNDWYAWNIPELPADAVPVTNYERACDPDTYLAAQDVWDGRRYTEFFRLAWRNMVPFNTERSLFAALVPPGPAHVDAVHTLALADNRSTALNAGFWAALPLDYLLRITGRSHLRNAEMNAMPAPSPDHPLASALLLRTLRLNCLTAAYAPLWAELYEPAWRREAWAAEWPGLAPLGEVGPEWGDATPLRTERERRAALVELDALVAVWLGIGAEELVAVYRSRFPVLADYEARTWFDAAGRKIAGSHNAYGHGQTKEHVVQLRKHLESPETEPVPEGYTAPFHRADREEEYRRAHAVFTRRLHASG